MSQQRFSVLVAVYLLLIRDGKILFLRRYNTGWEDGKYTLPAGHYDGHESIAEAMVREAREEVGIMLQSSALHVVHVAHHNSDKDYIDFYFSTTHWEGEPENKEPDKCDDVQWFPIDALPENTLPNVRQALMFYKQQVLFGEFNGEEEMMNEG